MIMPNRVMEIEIELEESVNEIEIEITEGGGSQLPFYNGDYVVSPKVKENVLLETKNKSMKDNVTVLEVPYMEVHNEKGTTLTIGGFSWQ